MQHPLINITAYIVPVPLLIVCSIMLQSSHHFLILQSFHVTYGYLRVQIRVFREILKIPSTQRRTKNIHTRSQQYMYTTRFGISPQLFSQFIHQFSVPGRSSQYPCRISCRFTVFMCTDRTIRQLYLGHAQTFDTSYIKAFITSYIIYFFFQCHAVEQIIRPVLHRSCFIFVYLSRSAHRKTTQNPNDH